jgi:hypothetical protein
MAADSIAPKPIAIVAANEPWSEFILKDGTKVRARLILAGAMPKPDGSFDLMWQIVTAPLEHRRADTSTDLDARPN